MLIHKHMFVLGHLGILYILVISDKSHFSQFRLI